MSVVPCLAGAVDLEEGFCLIIVVVIPQLLDLNQVRCSIQPLQRVFSIGRGAATI